MKWLSLAHITLLFPWLLATGVGCNGNYSQLAAHDLHLRFWESGESFYTDITLQQGVLRYTYFVDTEQRCAQWIKSTPCWQDSDLQTLSKPLNAAELEQLYALVQSSGISQLTQTTFGGARPEQRYYAQTLEVGIDGQQHTFTYQSFPVASPKPAAFAQIEQTLRDYAQQLAD